MWVRRSIWEKPVPVFAVAGLLSVVKLAQDVFWKQN